MTVWLSPEGSYTTALTYYHDVFVVGPKDLKYAINQLLLMLRFCR